MVQTMTGQEVSVEVEALDPSQIKQIRLADGVHKVENCEIVQFAIGEAHSPIAPAKLYPTLRYEENGVTWRTPLSQVLGFNDTRR
jgi:hypothetical protein